MLKNCQLYCIYACICRYKIETNEDFCGMAFRRKNENKLSGRFGKFSQKPGIFKLKKRLHDFMIFDKLRKNQYKLGKIRTIYNSEWKIRKTNRNINKHIICFCIISYSMMFGKIQIIEHSEWKIRAWFRMIFNDLYEILEKTRKIENSMVNLYLPFYEIVNYLFSNSYFVHICYY